MKITEFLKNPNYNSTKIDTEKGVYLTKFDKGLIFKIEDYFEMEIIKRKHSEIIRFDLNYNKHAHKFEDIFTIVDEVNKHFRVRYCHIRDTLLYKDLKANIFWVLSKGNFLYENYGFLPYQPRIFFSYHKEYLDSISYYYNIKIKTFYKEIKNMDFIKFINHLKEKYRLVKDHDSLNLLHRLQDKQIDKLFKIYGNNETKLKDFILYTEDKKDKDSVKKFYDIMYESLFLGELIPNIFIKIY